MLASPAFVWQVIHISKRGVYRGEEREGEIEKGRVAAFRTTDAQRGFIPSLQIQPDASSPGAKPGVCARLPPPLVTRRPRPPGFEDVPGAPAGWTSAFSCPQKHGPRSPWEFNLGSGFEKRRKRSAGRDPEPSVRIMLRTCQSSAPGPDCWREERQLLAKKLPFERSWEPAWRVRPSPPSTRSTLFFFFLHVYILERKARRRLQLIISLSFAIQWIFTAKQTLSQGCTVSSSTRVSLQRKIRENNRLGLQKILIIIIIMMTCNTASFPTLKHPNVKLYIKI